METALHPKTDYEVHTYNRPNAKDEDRHSKHSFRLNDTDITVVGVYDGMFLIRLDSISWF